MIKCLLTFTSVLGMACIISYTYFIWYCILKMDKLVKLLNEYERERQWLSKDFEDYTMWNIEWNEIVQSSCDPDSREYFKYYIISKDYQFIKWLVENKKIDEKKIDTRLVKYVESYYDEEWHWMENSYEDYSYTNTLLMLLAISDNPIDFLIEILK